MEEVPWFLCESKEPNKFLRATRFQDSVEAHYERNRQGTPANLGESIQEQWHRLSKSIFRSVALMQILLLKNKSYVYKRNALISTIRIMIETICRDPAKYINHISKHFATKGSRRGQPARHMSVSDNFRVVFQISITLKCRSIHRKFLFSAAPFHLLNDNQYQNPTPSTRFGRSVT